jgi:large subunit ribosomal protein L10
MRTRTDMPTRPPLPEKVDTVETLTQTLKESGGALLTDYRGMTVKAMSELRRALLPHGASYQVVKNTLLRRAANDLGYTDMVEWLEGPTAAVFMGKDVVAPAKALIDFVKGNANLPAIKGGFVEGRKLPANQVKALADLPSREMLLATLVGTLQSPMGGLLSTLQAAMAQLVGTLQSLESAKAG